MRIPISVVSHIPGLTYPRTRGPTGHPGLDPKGVKYDDPEEGLNGLILSVDRLNQPIPKYPISGHHPRSEISGISGFRSQDLQKG